MAGWKIALIVVVAVAVVLALVSVLVFRPLGWAIGAWVIGAGEVIADQHPHEGFDRVAVSNAIEVDIARSEDYAITVTGYENLVPRVEVDLVGQELRITLAPGTYFRNNVEAFITMPDLSGLTVSGASEASAMGFASTDAFEMNVSGASRVAIDMEAGNATADISGASRLAGTLRAHDTSLTLSGASRCELTGSAADMELDVSGASRADLLQFEVQNVDADVSGASRATINMTGTLNVELSGASTLEYTGDVNLGVANVTGASTLTRL